MPASLRIRRTVQLLALALVATTAAACDDDDPAGPEDEPEVATMRLTVGNSTVNVSETGTVTGGPLVFTNGATLTAQFLRADGSADPVAGGAEFRLEVVPSANLTFTRTGQFTGTLTSTVAVGQTTTATFSLFHTEEQHNDFGPFPVTLQRQ